MGSTLNMSKIATTIPLTTSKLWGNIPPQYYQSPLYSPVQFVNDDKIVEEVGAIESKEDELMEQQIGEVATTTIVQDNYVYEEYEEYVFEVDEPVVQQMEEVEEVPVESETTIGVKRSITVL